MDGWLKALIAGACVVVIGGGVYYGTQEYREYSLRADQTQSQEAARQELFKFAEIKPSDPAKLSIWCKRLEERVTTTLKDNDMARGFLNNCRVLGYM